MVKQSRFPNVILGTGNECRCATVTPGSCVTRTVLVLTLPILKSAKFIRQVLLDTYSYTHLQIILSSKILILLDPNIIQIHIKSLTMIIESIIILRSLILPFRFPYPITYTTA